MKFKFLFALAFIVSVIFTSCSSDEVILGNWVTKAFYEGQKRANGVSFSYDNKGYFGLGQNDDDYWSDLWQYNPDKNSWTQVASFPGTPRAYGVSTTAGSKGYFGLGYDGTTDYADFWEYDFTKNEWTPTADFGGGTRRYATAFAIGNDVYAGTGSQDKNKTYFNDFYKLSNGSWTKVAGFGGQKRIKANSFSINGIGYIVSGLNNSTLNDIWGYDPNTDTWTEFNEIDDTDNNGLSTAPRHNATTFVVNGKAYLAFGVSGNSLTYSIVEWDPATDTWTEKNGLENSSSREGTGTFVINNVGYIVGGRNGSAYYDDCYMFEPSKEKDTDD